MQLRHSVAIQFGFAQDAKLGKELIATSPPAVSFIITVSFTAVCLESEVKGTFLPRLFVYLRWFVVPRFIE